MFHRLEFHPGQSDRAHMIGLKFPIIMNRQTTKFDIRAHITEAL